MITAITPKRQSPTAETRKKISIALMGRPGHPHSAETRAKISAANMGHPVSEETRKKWSAQRKGNKYALGYRHNILAKEKNRRAHLGKSFNPETIARMKDGRRKRKNNANWKGGRSILPHLIRTNFKYRQWRSDIFTRDNFTCAICGDNQGGNLHAHHYPTRLLIFIRAHSLETIEEALACEKLWDINNGITLCETCHRKEHSGELTA